MNVSTEAAAHPRSRGRRRTALALVVSALGIVFLLALLGAAPAGATEPIFVEGNTSCTAQGYDFGFKIEPPEFPSFAGTHDIDGINTVTVETTDDVYFDWESTLGIDAVIVKGGSDSNVYKYDPESFGDTGLHSPINDNNDQPFGLSHIEFCYDYELTVSKTANTSFTRTFNWDIDKTVTPATWDLFTGDSGTSEYTVTLTKTGFTDSNWAVDGVITITNNTPFAATVETVSDVVSPAINAPVDCDETLPHELASGATLECTYATALLDGTDRTNTATATTTDDSDVGDGEATVDVVFSDTPDTIVNDTINVTDTFDGVETDLGAFSDTGTATYERKFTCDDEGENPNTATIDETGQEASANVDVKCYELNVTKDATTSFNRTWEWTIDKSADQTDLTLSEGQTFTVNYTVTVPAPTSTDGDFAVSGDIAVNNPAPIDATITGVADIVSPGINATVDCGVSVSFPYTLPAGETLNCTYSATQLDGTDTTNTATATLQNYDYPSEGAGTPNGTTDFSGTAAVVFSDTPDTETDECIDVTDTNVADPLGTVCADDDFPQTFKYSLTFGTADTDADVVLECGENPHENVASFLGSDGATGSDNWVVNATVNCDQGCTLTPGYWKTHSNHGPAPEDLAWFNLGPSGADTTFFLSGKTYYQVLWTAPQGNAYYILANAYIAAKLNILDGASAPSGVTAAITSAETFFNSKTPTSTLTRPERNAAIALATTLDNYNNGLTGPGHCSE